MQLRGTFVIAAVVAIIAAIFLRQRAHQGTDVPVAHRLDMEPAALNVPRNAVRAGAPQPTADLAASGAEPTASGAIHFEREGSDASTNERIDVNVRAAVGVWQPEQHRLLVYLFEREPTPARTAQLVASVPSDPGAVGADVPGAIVDVEFTPTAQAFDRNDIDRASLTAWNAKGDRSEADVLGGLSWSGSLPSPQADGAPAVTLLDLRASGTGRSLPITWRQSWNFTVAAQVSAAPLTGGTAPVAAK